jgi:hypothetical protein
MPERFEPKTAKLSKAQQEIWSLLAPTVALSYVLYGGTAVVLYLGHRVSVDFDFFRSAPLDKEGLERSFEFIRGAQTLQEDMNTLVVMALTPSGSVKVSFFGGLTIGRINEPLQTADARLLVASLEDLLATKLKAILDRAEARDYQDINDLPARHFAFSNLKIPHTWPAGHLPLRFNQSLGFKVNWQTKVVK